MGIEEGQPRRVFRGDHHGLPKAAKAVAGEVPAQVGKECPKGLAIARQPAGNAPGAENAARLLMQIFRQVEDLCLDLAMDRVEVLVRGMAQRDDFELEAVTLQFAQFLRDEGLRQARIALENDADAFGAFSVQPWRPVCLRGCAGSPECACH